MCTVLSAEGKKPLSYNLPSTAGIACTSFGNGHVYSTSNTVLACASYDVVDTTHVRKCHLFAETNLCDLKLRNSAGNT